MGNGGWQLSALLGGEPVARVEWSRAAQATEQNHGHHLRQFRSSPRFTLTLIRESRTKRAALLGPN